MLPLSGTDDVFRGGFTAWRKAQTTRHLRNQAFEQGDASPDYSRTDSSQGKFMSIIAWIVLGLIAGFIASKIVNKSGEGVLLDIVLGIVGAVLGGYLFQTFGMAGVTGVNLYSILVAVVGAIVFLVIYHAIFRGRARV
jgi:uncharacterized membrane protein YeaQ/YmgE (transglycosylase-associated protein family)